MVDTGVFVSALIGPRGGTTDRLVRAFADDRIEVVACPMLLAELERVLLRPKFRRYVDATTATQYVERIARHATVAVDPKNVPSVVRDSADDYLVALCRQEAVEFLVSGDADLLDAELSGVTVLRPNQLVDRLAAVLGAEGEAMAAAREALRKTREGWAGVFGLMGGHGYRPRLSSAALVAYRGDGSTVTITSEEERLGDRYDDRPLRATLRAPDRAVVETVPLELRESEAIVEAVLELLARKQEVSTRSETFTRHFPPENELARMTLTAAYARYRPYLDALAERGVHAYLESVRGEMRIFSDISPTLLLDISIGDEGVPVFETSEGEWVVFLDTPDGYEAEFTVDHYDDPDDDAESLADAVADALSHVLLGGHIFMQHYDPEFGRLDPSWLGAKGD